MSPSRRELLLTGLVCGAGCARLREPKATVVDSVSGASSERYVNGQPTLSDAPAVDVHLATEQTAFDALLRAEATETPLGNSFRQQRRRFESGRHFWTVLAAATRGQSLQSYRDARIRDGSGRVLRRAGRRQRRRGDAVLLLRTVAAGGQCSGAGRGHRGVQTGTGHRRRRLTLRPGRQPPVGRLDVSPHWWVSSRLRQG